MGQKLIEALRTFKVDGQLVGRTTGPVVTQFEIEPSPGVKVRQFANLANDLALAMRAQSIRIVAPIPGRGAVGVEVPNPHSEIVAFRELIESRDFQEARAALPIALGKDLEGKPVIADLAKMPHLLIAGATGSGKSVCVNTIITSLVYRHTPRTLRLLMVDPKMVELSVYNTLPHLRHKVVTDNRDAAFVLHLGQAGDAGALPSSSPPTAAATSRSSTSACWTRSPLTEAEGEGRRVRGVAIHGRRAAVHRDRDRRDGRPDDDGAGRGGRRRSRCWPRRRAPSASTSSWPRSDRA